jgi:hypothetical protein
MANNAKTDLAWRDVDTDSFTGPLKKAYEAKKAQDAISRTKREAFEEAAIAAARAKNSLADNQTYTFSYRFGKLTVALIDLKKAKAKATVATALKF